MPKGRAPVQHAALGVSAVAGSQVWDPQARFIIRFGPLTRQEFEALLPGTPAWLTVTQLARLFEEVLGHHGEELGFAGCTIPIDHARLSALATCAQLQERALTHGVPACALLS